MHIKLSKNENAKRAPRQPLTPDAIASAVQAYLAGGGTITQCPTPKRR